jgi:hypothetical protein
VTAGPFAEATAYGMLASVAARDGGREAIVFDGERITFRAFLARVEAFAAGSPPSASARATRSASGCPTVRSGMWPSTRRRARASSWWR